MTRRILVPFVILTACLPAAGCNDRCDHERSELIDHGGDGGAPASEGRGPPAADVFSGIGWPCSSDADCNSGTVCDELEDYCTAPCEQSSDCEAHFGGFTHCRLDNDLRQLCAATCGSDDECHPFMLCNTASNHCYRAGHT